MTKPYNQEDVDAIETDCSAKSYQVLAYAQELFGIDPSNDEFKNWMLDSVSSFARCVLVGKYLDETCEK